MYCLPIKYAITIQAFQVQKYWKPSQFLDQGKNGENMVLYNNHLANEDETRGHKRALSPMISFTLTLCD